MARSRWGDERKGKGLGGLQPLPLAPSPQGDVDEGPTHPYSGDSHMGYGLLARDDEREEKGLGGVNPDPMSLPDRGTG